MNLMMMTPRAVMLAAMLSCVWLVGCSDDDDPDTGPASDDPALAAPESLAGRTYEFQVLEGSNAFASTGNFSIVLDETNYVSTGNGDVGSSAGTYTYTRQGNQGTVDADDSSFGPLTFFMTFTAPGVGNYAIRSDLATAGEQSGTFAERISSSP